MDGILGVVYSPTTPLRCSPSPNSAMLDPTGPLVKKLTAVKLDPFHYMKRITDKISKKHPALRSAALVCLKLCLPFL